MTIINSILLALAGEKGGVMENLDQLDQLRERFKKYSGASTWVETLAGATGRKPYGKPWNLDRAIVLRALGG